MSTAQQDTRLAKYVQNATTVEDLKSALASFLEFGHIRTMDYMSDFCRDNRLAEALGKLVEAAEALTPALGESAAVAAVVAAVVEATDDRDPFAYRKR